MTFLDQALLSVQRARLGEITPEMRGVTVAADGRHMAIRVCHKGKASEQLRRTSTPLPPRCTPTS